MDGYRREVVLFAKVPTLQVSLEQSEWKLSLLIFRRLGTERNRSDSQVSAPKPKATILRRHQYERNPLQ